MAEVQWIRLMVGMFDGNSFKKIKRARIGGVPFRDKLTSVWFELLDLAGKSNSNGYLVDNNEIPYHSFEDIATMLDREEKEIELCMQFFINERMVEIVDDVYCLTNFMRYQNQEGLDKIRQQTRKRVAEYRERKRLAQGNATCNVTVTLRNALEKEKEEDKEKEIHSFNRSCTPEGGFDVEAHIERRVEEEGFDDDESADVFREEVKEGLKMRYRGGSLGQGKVFMSDEQFNDLLDKLTIDEIDKYFEIVAECEKNGKRYKNKSHYQAILDMCEKDRRIKK